MNTQKNLEIAYEFEKNKQKLEKWFSKYFGINAQFKFQSENNKILESQSFIGFVEKVFVEFTDENFSSLVFFRECKDSNSTLGFVNLLDESSLDLFSAFEIDKVKSLDDLIFSYNETYFCKDGITFREILSNQKFIDLTKKQQKNISYVYDMFSKS